MTYNVYGGRTLNLALPTTKVRAAFFSLNMHRIVYRLQALPTPHWESSQLP